ncbi:SWI/SNF-related matrix-associated actin-dependent regulator of chromatin subfamily A containing DEAD/H box 1 [Toxocara canis]|uniref:SWI/SNF-related matrix-associated actin-dependent regulator of chromatin subfamily A containing DEAD/H box 1 homolog n=1 Tax=Toxocara canis TaxID=6265 RepID=A0A0B2W312_TOXCA|nr:SWI/SNF-related matrix-associated actin-dependent regulator of chromatin subfamily A containing DEAD/H box 1 [Toxocara canis]
MSAGSFAVGGEKRRVAHRPNASSVELIRELAFKRQSLSKMVNQLCSKKGDKGGAKKENGVINGTKVHKKSGGSHNRKVISSEDEEEEELGDDYDGLEENESLEEKLERNVSKRSSSPSPPAASDLPSVSSDLTFQQRLRTLSDSESEGENVKSEAKWLCKPIFNGKKTSDKMRHVGRKRAFISTSSEEESADDDQDKPLVTLKQMVKRAKKRKVKSASPSDESDAIDSEENAHIDSETDSDDSRVDERRSKKRITASSELNARCLAFFNSANREKLMTAPRVTAKVAEYILERRPFDNFQQLQSSLSECPRGSSIAEQYIDYLENRGMLEAILDDCRHHSEQMQTALEALRLEQMPSHPKLLNKNYELHPYQQVGMNWLLMMHKLNLNAILGDEMGLGKTIQVIAFLAYLKENNIRGPHLIVVPSSTIENWMSELANWAPSIKILTYYGSMDDRRQLRAMATDKSIDVLLTTYNMVGSRAQDRKFFKRFKINYVIYDEGHLLKSCHTERYKNLMKVRGQRKILLTGTPLQNNLMELISLMYFTMTKLFTKYCDDITHLLQQFQQKIPAMEAKSGSLYEADKIEQAKAILRPYILRRLKANVLSCLPKKSERVIRCKMSAEQQEIYDDLVREFRELEASAEKTNAGRLMQLRQIANHPLLYRKRYHDDRVIHVAKVLCKKETDFEKKNADHVAEDLAFLSDFAISQLCSKYTSTEQFCLDEKTALESGKFKELDRLLPDIKKKGDKVLIFSQFTTMMDILEVYLRLRAHEYCRLDGSTPVMERQELINAFNSSKNLFVFLLSTKAGGMGINLTAANHIILHDIDFNPYNDKQAEDRCHRMGQKKCAFIL